MNPIHASIHHWLFAVSVPNLDVGLLANYFVVGFVANLSSLTQDAVGELAGEKADFRE